MTREALPQEYPELLDIQLACIQGLTHTYSQNTIDTWASYIENEGPGRYANYTTYIFADSDTEIAGFVSWSRETSGPDAAIECLYVPEGHQGKGIGGLLLGTAEANLRDATIHVRSTLNARPFYEHNGYNYRGSAVSRAGFVIALLEKNQQYGNSL